MSNVEARCPGVFDAGAPLDAAIRAALADGVDLPSLPAGFAESIAVRVRGGGVARLPLQKWVARIAASLAVAACVAWAAVEIAIVAGGRVDQTEAFADALEMGGRDGGDAPEPPSAVEADLGAVPGDDGATADGSAPDGLDDIDEPDSPVSQPENRLADAPLLPASEDDDPCIISSGANKTGIDSGYRYNALSRIEVEFAFDAGALRRGMRIFGADREISSAGASVSFGIEREFGHAAFTFRDPDDPMENIVVSMGMKYSRGRCKVVVDQKNSVAHYIVGATTNITVSIPGVPAEESDLPIALFGNSADMKNGRLVYGGYKNSAKARIYRARFYTDDVLVRDLVPVVMDGVPGFLDMAGGGFTGPDADMADVFSASPATPELKCRSGE